MIHRDLASKLLLMSINLPPKPGTVAFKKWYCTFLCFAGKYVEHHHEFLCLDPMFLDSLTKSMDNSSQHHFVAFSG